MIDPSWGFDGNPHSEYIQTEDPDWKKRKRKIKDLHESQILQNKV